MLTPEEIKARLMTRGFESGFQASPLRDFWGVLTDYTGDMKESSFGGDAYLVVTYNFGNIEVIESSEPYTASIAQIQISHNVKEKSRYGYWGTSIDKVINPGVASDVPQEQVNNQDYLLGKMCHVKITPGHMIWNKNDRKELSTDCWELLEIRGESPTMPAANASQVALELLNGKTEQQWHKEVFANPIVKVDSGVMNSIIGSTFLPPLEAAGIITKDENGIYNTNGVPF